MMKRIMLALLLSSGSLLAQHEGLKVLIWGNSFTVSAMRETPNVARAMGLKLDIADLYIGATTLKNHVNNYTSASASYEVTWNYGGEAGSKAAPFAGKVTHGGKTSANFMLTADEWDIVIIQQSSLGALEADTFRPYGQQLLDIIAQDAPQAEVILQETWSYPPFDTRMEENGYNQKTMYEKVHAVAADFSREAGIERTIPMGTAVQMCRGLLPVGYSESSFGGDPCGSAAYDPSSGTWSGDLYHLNSEGHYLQGLVWTGCLFGVDPLDCPYRPAAISEERGRAMRRAARAANSESAVSFVRAVQRWPFAGQFDIYFSLKDVPAKNSLFPYKVSFAARIGEGEYFPLESISGESAGGVLTTPGIHHLVWDAEKDLPDTSSDQLEVKVEAVSMAGYPYAVLDLASGDMRFSLESPDISGEKCRSEEIWLRRVEAQAAQIGSPSWSIGRNASREAMHAGHIIAPYYIGIFEVTQAQFKALESSLPSKNFLGDDRPVNRVAYNTLRGTEAGATWPAKRDYRLDEDSVIGRLRKRARNLTFDLPTDDQWECACRSGSTNDYGNGTSCLNGTTCANLAIMARYSGTINDGRGGAAYNGGPTRVGCYEPNNWGLYDMHGNVWEWCLTWQKNNGTEETYDDCGPISGLSDKRSLRGGRAGNKADACRASYRDGATPSTLNDNYGFRLVWNL